MKARQEGAGQARAATRRARRRMVATQHARSVAAGCVRGAEQAGPACAAGPKARRAAHLLKNVLFQILFKSFFIQMKF